MQKFYFKQKATIYYTIEAKDENEAFAILEDIDPASGEIYYEDAELDEDQ